MLGIIEEFRTANWPEIIKYPELVYQKSEHYLNYHYNYQADQLALLKGC